MLGNDFEARKKEHLWLAPHILLDQGPEEWKIRSRNCLEECLKRQASRCPTARVHQFGYATS